MDFDKLERELMNGQLTKSYKVFATLTCSFYRNCKNNEEVGMFKAQELTDHYIKSIISSKNKVNDKEEIDKDFEYKEIDFGEIENVQKDFTNLVCGYYIECKSQKDVSEREALNLTKSFISGVFLDQEGSDD